jgi:hypothetical protein
MKTKLLEGKIRGKIGFLGMKKRHGGWGEKSSLIRASFPLSQNYEPNV